MPVSNPFAAAAVFFERRTGKEGETAERQTWAKQLLSSHAHLLGASQTHTNKLGWSRFEQEGMIKSPTAFR